MEKGTGTEKGEFPEEIELALRIAWFLQCNDRGGLVVAEGCEELSATLGMFRNAVYNISSTMMTQLTKEVYDLYELGTLAPTLEEDSSVPPSATKIRRLHSELGGIVGRQRGQIAPSHLDDLTTYAKEYLSESAERYYDNAARFYLSRMPSADGSAFPVVEKVSVSSLMLTSQEEQRSQAVVADWGHFLNEMKHAICANVVAAFTWRSDEIDKSANLLEKAVKSYADQTASLLEYLRRTITSATEPFAGFSNQTAKFWIKQCLKFVLDCVITFGIVRDTDETDSRAVFRMVIPVSEFARAHSASRILTHSTSNVLTTREHLRVIGTSTDIFSIGHLKAITFMSANALTDLGKEATPVPELRVTKSEWFSIMGCVKMLQATLRNEYATRATELMYMSQESAWPANELKRHEEWAGFGGPIADAATYKSPRRESADSSSSASSGSADADAATIGRASCRHVKKMTFLAMRRLTDYVAAYTQPKPFFSNGPSQTQEEAKAAREQLVMRVVSSFLEDAQMGSCKTCIQIYANACIAHADRMSRWSAFLTASCPWLSCVAPQISQWVGWQCFAEAANANERADFAVIGPFKTGLQSLAAADELRSWPVLWELAACAICSDSSPDALEPRLARMARLARSIDAFGSTFEFARSAFLSAVELFKRTKSVTYRPSYVYERFEDINQLIPYFTKTQLPANVQQEVFVSLLCQDL